MAEQKPIIFEIDGQTVTLPVADVITVGRAHAPTDPNQPHVDLSAFGAEDRGVSRVHLRIRRKGILVYVSDLHSTNGTHLNGRKLIPDGERLLRDGDELYLSRMLIKVHF
jgi:pSer/pThr/pTyr-binding forkhead associated (FHA) protein